MFFIELVAVIVIVTYFAGFRAQFQGLRRRNPPNQFLHDRAILAQFLKIFMFYCLSGFSQNATVLGTSRSSTSTQV